MTEQRNEPRALPRIPSETDSRPAPTSAVADSGHGKQIEWRTAASCQ